jgi:hypothetical protein
MAMEEQNPAPRSQQELHEDDAFHQVRREMENLRGEVTAGYNFVKALPITNFPSEPTSPAVFRRNRTQSADQTNLASPAC